MICRMVVGIVIVEAAVRPPLCKALSMVIFIFPTAHRLGSLVLRMFVRASRDMDVIWTGKGMVWDASEAQLDVGIIVGAKNAKYNFSPSNQVIS